MARGIDAQALSHNGEAVPVQLRLSSDRAALHVAVPGESRNLPLADVKAIAFGEEAWEALRGRLPSRPPTHVIALRLLDGNCLAVLLPSEQAPDKFAVFLDKICTDARFAQEGHLSRGTESSSCSTSRLPEQASSVPPSPLPATFSFSQPLPASRRDFEEEGPSVPPSPCGGGSEQQRSPRQRPQEAQLLRQPQTELLKASQALANTTFSQGRLHHSGCP
ncbi:unnamed protein product, partial [Polarella glacialis]